MSAEEFPKALHHPQFRKGKMTALSGKDPVSGKPFTDYQGEPDMFPDVTVNNADQEGFYRAKGYLGVGEAPPAPVAYAEYPVMLSHPEHQDAVPDSYDIIGRKENGQLETRHVQGVPEKFPPMMAKTPQDEKMWVEKGYMRIGKSDGAAIQRAKASPYDPDYKVDEYPKIVDGKIVDPHASMEHNRYPMYVGDTLVNSAEEEAAARGNEAPVAVAVEACVICGDAIADGEPFGEGPRGKFHTLHMVAVAVPVPGVVAEAAPPPRGRAPVRKTEAPKDN